MASKRGIEAGRAFVKAWLDDSLLVRGLKGLKTKFAAAGSGMMRAGFGAIGAGATAAGALLAPLARAASLEQTQAAFESLLGSADKAKKTMADLRTFAKETPFEFPELADAGRSLLAFGVAQEQLIPTLRSIGDVAAGVGAPIGEIAEIYGKAKVQGRLFAEDINQLTGRGIPIIGELAKQFGVSEDKVRGLVESGKVNFGNLEAAFKSLTGEGGKFAGLMEKQSETLLGRWSTLKDTFWEAVTPIGEALLPAAGKLAQVVTTLAEQTGEWVKRNAGLASGIVTLVAGIIGLGAAAVVTGFALTGVSAVIGAIFATVGFLASPLGLVVASLAAGAAAGAYFAHQSGLLGETLDWLKDRFGPLVEQAKTAFGAIKAALSAGDFKAAASIAMAALKVAWLSGTHELMTIWDKVLDKFRDGWTIFTAN
ncbi:MAG TPA: phage tail tape measure protein, partial [Planctomycetaceae bacterium]